MRAILLGHAFSSLQKQRQTLSSLHLEPTDLKVGVDGGAAIWLKSGIQPDIAVGDWDSLPHSKTQLRGIPHLTLSRDKDRSDLFFAIRAALSLGCQDIVCLGVTGGRADHHLATLFELSEFSSGKWGSLTSVCALGEEEEYHFLSENLPYWRQKLVPHQTVSIFAMSEKVSGIDLVGFKYPFKGRYLVPSSYGLSNQSIGETCEVRLRKGRLLIIIPDRK